MLLVLYFILFLSFLLSFFLFIVRTIDTFAASESYLFYSNDILVIVSLFLFPHSFLEWFFPPFTHFLLSTSFLPRFVCSFALLIHSSLSFCVPIFICCFLLSEFLSPLITLLPFFVSSHFYSYFHRPTHSHPFSYSLFSWKYTNVLNIKLLWRFLCPAQSNRHPSLLHCTTTFVNLLPRLFPST